MSLIKVVLATLAFTIFVDNAVLSSPRLGPNENQYREREGEEGGGQPRVKMSRFRDKDATDRGLIPSKNHEDAQGNSRVESRQTGAAEKDRSKRSYYPYPTNRYNVPQFQSISAWRPSLYPIQRPYYVPIYGIDGRIPIYLAPQPWYINPGTPPKNPKEPPYVGPTYLPPATPKPTYLPPVTPPSNETTTMPTDDRFGGGDDDDRPIWDNGNEPPATARPPSMVPTRKPAPARDMTYPPLVHGGGSSNGGGSSSSGSSSTVTTNAPALPPPEPLPGPSRCVWAIVSCCSTSSTDVSYRCFDQLGCSGPFWDVSPCETEYARAAIQAALNYYNSRA